MSKIYSYAASGLTTGNTDITEVEEPDIARATTNRITIEKGSATGTVTLFVKIKHASAFQPLLDESTGSAVSITLASLTAPVNYRFAGDIEAWRITGTSITGGTFNASCAGWE